MVIREMQAQDVEAVTALEAACFTQPWKRIRTDFILLQWKIMRLWAAVC